MHLAFITSLITDGKPTTGFEVANEAIVAGLRETGCKITQIGFRLPRQANIDEAQTIVLQTLDVENASASTLQKIKWMAGAITGGLPVGGSKLRAVPWSRLESALNSLGDIDGMVINSVQMPTAFPQLLEYAPYIYVAHNVEHQSSRQNAKSANGLLDRILYQRDVRLLEPIEMKLCKKARHVFFLSEDDRKYFKPDDYMGTVLQLAFPSNKQNAVVKPDSALIANDVGLIGTWSWQPNFVGLTWFLDEVVPLLNSDMIISIAGSMPNAVNCEHPGVNFVGRVNDAEEFVKNSGVLALVSRSGTGVQLKTIEAFQMGMPCCATLSSVRGIAGIPANCAVEDDAKNFSKVLNKMVKNCRDGKLARLDGEEFAASQRDALHAGLRVAIESIKPIK